MIRNAPIRRWIELTLYAGLGTAIVPCILGPLLQPIGASWGTYMANMPWSLFVGIAIVLGTAGIAGLAPLRTSRPIHLIEFRHPSWIWAVLLGVIASGAILHIANQRATGSPPQAGDWISLAIIMVVSILAGSALTKWFTPKQSSRPTQKSNDTAPTNELDQVMAWIDAPDSPITDAKHDLFGFAVSTTQRMARHLLYDEHCPCIGLIGAFGSGKTGILKLLEDNLKLSKDSAKRQNHHPPPRLLWVAWVRSWGQMSGASAAQQVLEAALDELANHVDCLALSNLPRRYQEAMHASQSTSLGILAALGSPGANPEEALQRFDPVLEALDAHLVLFIEDLDRNQTSPALFAEVQALLDRLKQKVERIRFVIAVGSDAHRHIDFAKLCDRYEMLPPIPKKTTERLVELVTRRLYEAYPDDINWTTSDRDKRQSLKLPDPVLVLLSQPRSLRLTLRYVVQAWPQLHGEIDLQEMLLVDAVRASTPSAFEFLSTHITDLRGCLSASEDKKKEHGKYLINVWNEAMADIPPRIKSACEAVLNTLFPSWKQGSLAENEDNPQSIRHGPHAGIELVSPTVDYWQRLFAEEVTGRRDQDVAKAMRAWLNEPEQALLPKLLVSEPGYAEHFERLLPSPRQQSHPLFFNRKNLRGLTEQVHKLLLERAGVSASGDDDACIVLWRFALNRATPEDHLDWVEKEIECSLNCSLRLALDVERRWTYKKFGTELQPEVRKRMVAKVREMIEANGMEALIQILDASYPYSLNHLIRHQYDNAVFAAADWQWLVPQLLEEAEQHPDILVPQLAMLITKTAHQHELDEETGLPSEMRQITEFDEAYLVELIPDDGQRIALLKLIAKERLYPNLDERRIEEMRQIRAQAIKWLQANSSVVPSAPSSNQ